LYQQQQPTKWLGVWLVGAPSSCFRSLRPVITS